MNYNELEKNLEVFSLGDAQPGHLGNPSQVVSGQGWGKGRKDIHQVHEGCLEWEVTPGADREGR